MVATVRYLGRVLREGIRVTRANEARHVTLGEQVRTEHRAIVDAIAAGDAEQARAAGPVAHENSPSPRIADVDEASWDKAPDVDATLTHTR